MILQIKMIQHDLILSPLHHSMFIFIKQLTLIEGAKKLKKTMFCMFLIF